MIRRMPAKILRLHLSERDRHNGAPLHEAVVNRCRSLGIAGATVFQGFEGYGESTQIHRSRVLGHDLPITVTIVDSAANIERLIVDLKNLVNTGLVAVSDVEMIRIERRSDAAGHPPD
jgi:uncharacterized protein